MPESTAILSLGSNLGNRLLMLERAIRALCASGFSILAKSRVWETAPWGVTDQPRFLNMCLSASVDLNPEQMLETVKAIETSLGRTLCERWGPREIDIDIILLGDAVIDLPSLKVPHPLFHKRAFVLVPLTEIAPRIVHPLLKKTAAELLACLPKEQMNWIIKI